MGPPRHEKQEKHTPSAVFRRGLARGLLPPEYVAEPKVSLRYKVFCCDYDGTLASEGLVSADAVAVLKELREAGWKLVMVTGRILPDLRSVFARLDLFDRVVLENGAVLYRPEDDSETLLGSPPPASFVEALRRRGVTPLEVGRVIVATRVPHESAVLDTIRRQGLELQIIFNKGAVMVLPAGVNKHSGVAAALEELGLTFHDAVGVGDAENDLAFLRDCELSVAVANALQSVIERSHLVTAGARSQGVVEVASLLLRADRRDHERQRRLERARMS